MTSETTAAITLTGEVLGALWIAVPVLTVFGVCEYLFHRRGLDGEVTRKISHVGAGFIVFCMPWAVQSHWTVLVLAFGFVVILGGSKLIGLLPSVHRVSRKTSGAQYYPVAVYLTFVLAHGDPLLFGVPMLVMALSDTGAAVVGRRYGIVRYRVIEDYRSLGGSVTFFGLTFAVVLVGLGLAGHGDLPSVLLITLLTAMVATAVEGISVRGADNLLVPYATFLVLRATIGLGREDLGSWILGAALALGILLVSYRQARLSATAFMAVFVTGVLAWGLGGPVWFVTLLVPYIGFSATRPVVAREREADLRVIVPAFAVSLSLVLAYGHTGLALLFIPFLASVASLAAIALAGVVRAQLRSVALESMAALVGAASATVPAVLLPSPLVLSPAGLAVIAGSALLGPVVVHSLESQSSVSHTMARFAGVLVGTAASLIWVLGQAIA